jgi:predicted nucleotide-binding protein (sugar kinase/HSP70/actin superfamily)
MSFTDFISKYLSIEEIIFPGIVLLSLILSFGIWYLSKIFYGDVLDRAYTKSKAGEAMSKREKKIWEDFERSINRKEV